jgi:hypothetical protein
MSLEKVGNLKQDRAYRLDWNIDHIIDGAEEDAWLRVKRFPNAPDESAFWRIKKDLNLPERVEFDAVGEVFESIDYPYTDVRWPIMSNRMLDALRSVGDFYHVAYPLVMIDCEQIYNAELGTESSSGIEFHNFFAVHILEDLDVFDCENSVYEFSKNNSSNIDICSIEKVVLKEPEKGFPPLFRDSTLSTRLYVSAEARTALEAAGIRGVDFIQVENNYTVVSALP